MFQGKARQAPRITLSGGVFLTSATFVPDHAAKSLLHICSNSGHMIRRGGVAYFFIKAVADIESSASTPTAVIAARVIVLIDGSNGRIRNFWYI